MNREDKPTLRRVRKGAGIRPVKVALISAGIALSGLALTAAGQFVNGWTLKLGWDRVRTVEVLGVVRLAEADIRQAAGVPLGASLMNLPLDAVAARIEKVPGVEKARVVRRPPGRLVINITERRAVAMTLTGSGRSESGGIMLIDSGGMLFPLAGIGEKVDLPLITADVPIGTPGAAPKYRKLLNLILRLERDFPALYRHLGEAAVVKGRIELRLREGGALVKALDPEDDVTLTKLEQFLDQKGRDLSIKSQYIDLRHPGLVVTGTDG